VTIFGMVDPVAIWGALTGTAGAGIAVRREALTGRRRLTVQSSLRIITSRLEPDLGHVLAAFACVGFWNTGGRSLAIERVGFRFFVDDPAPGQPFMRVAYVHLDQPIEAGVDGPSHQVFTPLGPMLAAGIDPFGVLEAIAVTTGGKEWQAPMQPLVFSLPPGLSAEEFSKDLVRLREEADRPPMVGDQIPLKPAEPVLPSEEIAAE
jgi:hypothetical protein